MRRTRRRRRTALSPVVLVIALGLASGLAFACARGAPPPPRARQTPPRPAAGPPETIRIDDAALDRALRQALDAAGAAVEAGAPAARRDGANGRTLRWTTTTWRVRAPAGTTVEALALAAADAAGRIEGAWTRTAARSGRTLTLDVGVRVRGRELVTHRLVIEPVEPRVAPARPRVAIIFDDAGARLEDLDRVAAIGRPATIAVLPGLAHSAAVAEAARARGLDVLLHQPLEPEDASKVLGPGGVVSTMPDDEIRAVVRANLDGVPGAVGLNNHMGSKGTADTRVMRAVLSVIRERRLFFVDSVTSPRSIAARLAREMGIRTVERRVFLDNSTDPGAIRAQVRRLIALALEHGTAVAIGHANRPNTAEVIREMLPEFDRAGVDLVGVSNVVR